MVMSNHTLPHASLPSMHALWPLPFCWHSGPPTRKRPLSKIARKDHFVVFGCLHTTVPFYALFPHLLRPNPLPSPKHAVAVLPAPHTPILSIPCPVGSNPPVDAGEICLSTPVDLGSAEVTRTPQALLLVSFAFMEMSYYHIT